VSAEPLPPTPANGRPTSPTPARPTTPARAHAPRGTVYLLHFDQRYVHAGHYTGWAEHLDQRLAQHQRGTGARLVEVITQAGIGFRVARLWPGASKAQERSLKNSGGASRYCPICRDERKARGEHLRPPRGRDDHHPEGADQPPAPRRARNRGRESAVGAVPTRGVRPGQAREFMALNPAFARPVSGSLVQQWGRVRGREEIEALGPRVTGARFEENQPLSQKRTTAVIRRAVQARVQARHRELDERAEQTRTRAVAARTHQQLTNRADRAGQRPHRRDRAQPTSNPREGGHER
jgi:predicted GIY-YIG superfamily endonuclease